MPDIVYPLAESQRTPAGRIYYEAFQRKPQPLVGQPAATRNPLRFAPLRPGAPRETLSSKTNGDTHADGHPRP